MATTFERAATGRPVSRTPVWFMRQAGRSLPEYLKLREGTSMLESCRRPDMVTEITMQPVRRHGVDAAIFFSDIVVPLQAAGVGVEIKPGVGPVMDQPIRRAEDIDALPELTADDIPDIAESVRGIVEQLPEDTPLIGFAGAPFTLASYLIESGPSKNHEKTKAMMVGAPELFDRLLSRLDVMSELFIRTQVEAGASAFQVFDSWAGYLCEADYRRYVLPHTQRLFSGLSDLDVPSIHFGVQTGELLSAMSEAGSTVVGVDFRVDLAEGIKRLQPHQAVQGNLDPAMLFAPWEALRERIEAVVRKGLEAPGFVFNLGHGVLPNTDPEVPGRVVREVHRISEQVLAEKS